ncbi:MAG: L-seryl-tRNA(Sec) selenium transferase [Campylobacter sp.]
MSEFRKIPQIDKIVKNSAFIGLQTHLVTKFARAQIDDLRSKISNGDSCPSEDEIIKNILKTYENFNKKTLQSVINATGVILHTNLGRSVISDEILRRASNIITGYSNLEYSLETGSRSNRYDYVGSLAAELFGFEDAIVVNNNASAVFLVLNTFASGGETVVSRGELVEIGGNFRVPEVMVNSGTILKEVGTTNKTNLQDYENAINENTKMLVKIHRSNFEMIGFTKQVKIDEISRLAKQKGLIDYYDLGSGFFGDLPFGLSDKEDSLNVLSKIGVSLVSLSGDKLLGSVQCGIILGKKELINKLKKNQLLRMLRLDKVIISLLIQSLNAYANGEFELISTLKMLKTSQDELKKMAQKINMSLKNPLKIVQTSTFVGGGAMPNKQIPSIALVIQGDANVMEEEFRNENVIGRIENDKFLLDLRSVLQKDVEKLIKVINKLDKK